MWKFQGSVKKEVEILGVFKKKTNAEFPWVLVFDFGISKECHTNCRVSRGKSFFSPEFLGVKKVTNLKFPGELFRKVAIAISSNPQLGLFLE